MEFDPDLVREINNLTHGCPHLRRVLKVPKFLHFLREHHLNKQRIRIPFCWETARSLVSTSSYCSRVTSNSLSYFDVDAQCSQIRRQRMMEAVPTDLLADDACPY